MTFQDVLSSPEGNFAVNGWVFTFRRLFDRRAEPIDLPGMHRYIECVGFWFSASYGVASICHFEKIGNDWSNYAEALLCGVRAAFDNYLGNTSEEVVGKLHDFAGVLVEIIIQDGRVRMSSVLARDEWLGQRIVSGLRSMGALGLSSEKKE